MTKRASNKFERVPRDFYPTPYAPVLPLIKALSPFPTRFIEPCAGEGHLIHWLTRHGHECVWAADVEPRDPLDLYRIQKMDALDIDGEDVYMTGADTIITNPPWKWEMVSPMIEHLRNLAPTWLLLSADFKHNVRSEQHMKHCRSILSVGRVKWIAGSKHSGLDNAAWYEFVPGEPRKFSRFYPRVKKWET